MSTTTSVDVVNNIRHHHSWFPSEGFTAMGERIITNFDPTIRSGSIFIYDYSYNVYTSWFFSSVAFFFASYLVVDTILKALRVSTYVKSSFRGQVEHCGFLVGSLHHVILTVLTWRAAIYACSDTDHFPVQDAVGRGWWYSGGGGGVVSHNTSNDWSYFRWFVSPTCALQPNEMYPLAVLFTMAYLFVDFIVLQFLIQDKTIVQKQFILHHIIAITGFTGCLTAGFGLPGMACMTLLCEISSIFLNLRETFPKDQRHKLPYQINQFIFFLLFTVFRMCLFPFMLYQVWFDLWASWQFRSTFLKIVSVFCVIQAWATFLLNAYWYILILKKFRRALGEIGALSPVKKRQQEMSSKRHDKNVR